MNAVLSLDAFSVEIRLLKAPFLFRHVTWCFLGWQEGSSTKRIYGNCIEYFNFVSSFQQQMFQIKHWDRVYIIQENSHSWCGLTVGESGRWETVEWVKPPSVMCLLCYFFFCLSACDKHKHWIVPWTPCVLETATFPCKYSALHHPFFLHDHLLCSHFNTLHNISMLYQEEEEY